MHAKRGLDQFCNKKRLPPHNVTRAVCALDSKLFANRMPNEAKLWRENERRKLSAAVEAKQRAREASH